MQSKDEIASHLTEAGVLMSALVGAIPLLVTEGTRESLAEALAQVESVREELYQAETKIQMLRHEMREA